MTNKVFYQAAAAEVAAGHLDEALWIKVNAEMPGVEDKARQAKYVALRAEEMAVESAKHRVLRWMPHSFWSWALYLIVAFAVAYMAGAAAASIGQLGVTPIPLAIAALILLAAVAFGVRAAHAAAPNA